MKIPARARQGLRRNSLPQEMLEKTMSTIITITITITIITITITITIITITITIIQHPSS